MFASIEILIDNFTALRRILLLNKNLRNNYIVFIKTNCCLRPPTLMNCTSGHPGRYENTLTPQGKPVVFTQNS